MRAVVLALTDLGRSARMQYHAHALAASGVDVDFVGLEGTPLPARIADDPRIAVHRIASPTLRLTQTTGVAYAFAAMYDTLRTSITLWRCLRRLRSPSLVLTATPPAFPTLAIASLALRRRGVRFVVDWHNLGYTVLRMRIGGWHPVVRLARWFERRTARAVDVNLCVSRGMAAFLRSRFGVTNTHVLYDRPAAVFAPLQRSERERFRQGLFGRLGVRLGVSGLIVCPTSWTDDEDFDVIVEAVHDLEAQIRNWELAVPGRRFVDLVVLVTGDGARRRQFERLFAGLPARRVQLRTRWLEPEEYPRVVGSADLGLCLHRSSSGLDIPIKLADLSGAGVPVCALDYGACLAERVRHGDNGLLFSTSRQLAELLFDLFETFPADQSALDRLRAGTRRHAGMTWDEGWAREARPALLPEMPPS
ncbi:MAG: glycosyltransferase [Acidobacteriaceae bacterium]|jgi:beta-1,4-mannosyltransferase|nr:glycosyltransferase [Acidobacteriaceae bacterium]